MIRALLARLRQGHRTVAIPAGPALTLPGRFRGRPAIEVTRCPEGCRGCVEACPTRAIEWEPEPRIDLGRCLFCADCVEACPEGCITHRRDHRLAVRERSDLLQAASAEAGEMPRLARALDDRSRRLFGRSLRLRQVSAGGCNGCEVEAAVLGTLVFDMGRFGIQFVASPRHADGLLVTGPVTQNMRLALEKTWQATPRPRIVIAAGACAISGGPYLDHPEAVNGVASALPVDLFVPGCPPHPLTLLDGLLRLLGRIEAAGGPRPE